MERLMYSVDETIQTTGLGRTKVYELLATGELPSVKVGRRRMIPAAALQEFVADLLAEAKAS